MALFKCHFCDDDGGNGDDGHYACFVLTPTTTQTTIHTHAHTHTRTHSTTDAHLAH